MTGHRLRYLLGVLVCVLLLVGMALITTPLFVVPAAAGCGGTLVMCLLELLTINHNTLGDTP